MSRTAKSIEELFPIIAFARAGDLKSVRAWIDAGSPLNLPAGKRTSRQSPLQIAIDKGFLTLAEILLDGGADPLADRALGMAVDRGRVDIARLLLDRGVPLGDVNFVDVCVSHNVELIRLFLDKGADPIAGAPFYHALTQGLQPLVGFVKELLAKDGRLQPQVDDALVHFVEEKNPRGVSLMVWAGARPDAEISFASSDEKTTPLETAVATGDLGVLKALKPENYPHLLPRLLQSVSFNESSAVADYLLSLGAPLNDRDDGTSSILDALLSQIGWDTDPRLSSILGKPGRVDTTISRIEDLLLKGAKFPPIEARTLRQHIRALEPDKLASLLGIFKKTGAFSEEFLLELISTPKMRATLGGRWQTVRSTIGRKKDADTEPAEVPTAEPPKPKPLAPIAELRDRAEAAVLGILTRQSCLHFTVPTITGEWSPRDFRKRVGMTEEDEREEIEILRSACRTLASRLRLLELKVGETRWRSLPPVTFEIRPDTTWPTAIREALGLRDEDPLPLTRSGERFLQKVQSGAVSGQWIDREALNRQLGAGGHWRLIEDCCHELAQKRSIFVKLEERKNPKGPQGEEVRLELGERPAHTWAQEGDTASSLRWDRPIHDFGRCDVDAFREWILSALRTGPKEGKSPFFVFRIRTRAELAACLPRLEITRFNPGGTLAEFLRALRLPEGLALAFDLREETDVWWCAVVPDTSWPEALKAVEDERAKPTLEQRFGLSYDAARLLEWIESVPQEQFLGSWTPVVEPRLKPEVGLRADWPKDNLPALFQFLIDEINAKTAYQLSIQPWREQGQDWTRIKVARKANEDQELTAALSRWAVASGISVSGEKLSAALALLRRS